jgi:hypothetical protein
MATSHYKGPWIGKLPMCAICGGAGEGTRREHRLTHGVSVWLCEAHRSDEFQRRRGGRDFVASLDAIWRAAGLRDQRHSAALTAHLRRVRSGSSRGRPGSYAWPHLRREAERRFGSGHTVRDVFGDLATHCRARHIRCPSLRTVRRWFHEGRWLTEPRHARRASAGPRPPGASPVGVPAKGARKRHRSRHNAAKASPGDRAPP